MKKSILTVDAFSTFYLHPWVLAFSDLFLFMLPDFWLPISEAKTPFITAQCVLRFYRVTEVTEIHNFQCSSRKQIHQHATLHPNPCSPGDKL